MRSFSVAVLITVLGFTSGFAEVRSKTVEYTQGGATLEGFMAWDDAVKGPRPGVVVVHEWTGLGPYVKGRAEQLAKMGYVAFCADIYGKGVRPSTPQEAAATSATYRQDRNLTRARVGAALAELKRSPLVDPRQIAAIGYCFGGMVVLELARSGADLAGVVVFHGALNTPTPADAKNIKAKVLALQGGDDPFVAPAEVAAFEDEMRQGGVDWQLVQYGGAVHSYTNPASGNDASKGAAYNEVADRRSWEAMRTFLAEIFR